MGVWCVCVCVCVCVWCVCVCVKLDPTDLQIKPLSKFKFTVDQYSDDHILVRDAYEIVPVFSKFSFIVTCQKNFEQNII